MALTVTKLAEPHVIGGRQVFVAIAFDDDYDTGGEELTAAACGLHRIDAVVVTSAADAAGVIAVAPKLSAGTWKLMAGRVPELEIDDSVDIAEQELTEVAATTDLNAYVAYAIVFGQ